MENVVLEEDAKLRISAIQSLIRGYLEEKGYSEEDINIQMAAPVNFSLPARQKLLLQQMIRERAQRDGRDLDELIQEERKKTSSVSAKGQILGAMSKVESAYVEVLLQEKEERKVKVMH